MRHRCVLRDTIRCHLDRKGMECPGAAREEGAAHIGTANLIVPAAIFRSVGDSSETENRGRLEFCTRLKGRTKIMVDDTYPCPTTTGIPKTLGQFFKRELWHGLVRWVRSDDEKIDINSDRHNRFHCFFLHARNRNIMHIRQAAPGLFYAGTLGLTSC